MLIKHKFVLFRKCKGFTYNEMNEISLNCVAYHFSTDAIDAK